MTSTEHPARGLVSDGKFLHNAELSVRKGFVTKVFTLVFLQLLMTTVVSVVFMQALDIWDEKGDIKRNATLPKWIIPAYALASPVMLILACYAGCFPQKMRQHPTGSIILWTFTAACSVVVGLACAFTPKETVALAAGMTCAMTLALGIYAMKTTRDFTGMGMYLFCALIGLMIASMAISFTAWATGTPFFETRRMLAALGVILFSMYIVYDVQLIVGGAHKKLQFQIDDYNLAAMNLYLDIINLFIELLRLLGDR